MIFDVQYWFLKKTDLVEINTYRDSEIGREEVSLLNIFSLWGNLLPILIALGMSILLMDNRKYAELDTINIIRLINNGSIPLICYSIILSGVGFILDKTTPEHPALRRKVLGIGILLLFISVTLYTLLTSLNSTIKDTGHFVLLLISVFVMYNAVKITYTMVLLQNKVVNDFAKSVKKSRDGLVNATNETDKNNIEF